MSYNIIQSYNHTIDKDPMLNKQIPPAGSDGYVDGHTTSNVMVYIALSWIVLAVLALIVNKMKQKKKPQKYF